MIRRLPLVFVLSLALVLLTACQSELDTPTPPAAPVTPLPPSPAGALKITLAQTGIYRLPAATLSPAGLDPASLRPENIALFLGAEPVPFWVDPAGPTLYFYGQAFADRYTPFTTYLLRWGDGGGPQMDPETLPPPAGAAVPPILNTQRLEENRIYISRAAPALAEPWFWERFSPGLTVEFPFSLPAPLSTGEGVIRVGLWGSTTDPQTDPDHRVSLELNGRSLGSIDWDGETAITGTLTIPAGVLQEGENQLTITAPGDTGNLIDLSYLDWIEIDYPVPAQLCDGMLALPGISGDLTLPDATLLFDITDPAVPLRLTPTDGGFHLDEPRSLVALSAEGGLAPVGIAPLRSSDWSAASQPAEYVIITPAGLVTQLEPLAASRRGQGLSVAIVPLEDIYDGFGYGAATPLAINAFLQHAYQNWSPPQLRYVLLVGEASYDYHNYLELGPAYTIPPLLVPVSHGGETVSDSRLADLDGDGRPEIAIGRWPAATPEAVTALVRRTLAYEAAAQTPSRSIFAADDSEATFPDMSDRLIQAAGLEDTVLRLYGASGDEVVEAWNQGAWLVNYTGHGSLNLWGKSEILSQNALERLTPAGQPPIVVHLTCLTGLFAHPEIASLGEKMFWMDGGPVAVVAATSLTLPSDQEPFAAVLLEALTDPAVRTMGDAMLRAWQSPNLGCCGGQEIVDTFNLLGDPALIIARPN